MTSNYNYASFPLDMDGQDFEGFSKLMQAGERAPDGTVTDARTGERLSLSSLWKSQALVVEFGSLS